ncbi:MAG: hypothetical protein Q8L14_27305 [Myxococcales bacterium]|nr:hypothetical protein [Myxococcales bacterium]
MTEWADLVPVLAIVAMALATGAMVVALLRTKEPISTVLRRWGSRLMDAFWGLG